MPSRFVFLVAALLMAGGISAQTPFIYQGRLSVNNAPANGTFNLQFRLFSSLTGGNPLAEQTVTGVPISDGLFTAELDFGPAAFGGQARFIEVVVNATPLAPRQAISPTPYAYYAYSVPWDGIVNRPAALTPMGPAGGDLTGAYPNPSIAANAVTNTKLASDSASLFKVTGGAMRVVSGRIGIGVPSPGSDLTVGGVAEATKGFKFPDGYTQTYAMLTPEQVGFKSGLNGYSMQILIDGSTGPTPIVMAGSWDSGYIATGHRTLDPNTGQPIGYVYAGNQTYSSLTLRRKAFSGSDWLSWARIQPNGQFLRKTVTLLLLNGAGREVVRWEGQGFVSRWQLNLMDDGLPVEEITVDFQFFPGLTRTQAIVVEGVQPELGLRKGAKSGQPSGTSLRVMVAGNQLRGVSLVGNIGRHADVTELRDQEGALEKRISGTFPDVTTLRQSPVNGPFLYNWLGLATGPSRFKDLELVVLPQDAVVFRTAEALVYRYTLRIGDDGLPVEDYGIAFNLLNP